jgi:hypothetical protein
MTSRQLILFLAISLPASHAAFATNGCPGEIAPVRYHSTVASRIETAVTIDGSGPYTFIIDTGAQLTVIEPSLAAELHLESRGSAPLLSGTKLERANLVRPGMLGLGPHAVRHPLIAVGPIVLLQTADPKIRGILGGNFLMHFDLLIDHGRRILCLDDTGRMRQEVRGEHVLAIPSTNFPDDSEIPQPILIPVRLAEFGSRDVVLRVDSGASTPLLFAHPLVTASSIYERKKAQVAGTAAQYFATLPAQDIHIGKHLLRDIAFVTPIHDAGTQAPDGEDGLLPTALFDRVFVSNAGHFVILNPR